MSLQHFLSWHGLLCKLRHGDDNEAIDLFGDEDADEAKKHLGRLERRVFLNPPSCSDQALANSYCINALRHDDGNGAEEENLGRYKQN